MNVPCRHGPIASLVIGLWNAINFTRRLVLNLLFLLLLLLLLAVLLQWLLNRTHVGLNLRAVGENPATADAAGRPRRKSLLDGKKTENCRSGKNVFSLWPPWLNGLFEADVAGLFGVERGLVGVVGAQQREVAVFVAG